MIVVENHVNTVMVGVKDSGRVSRKNMDDVNDSGTEPCKCSHVRCQG